MALAIALLEIHLYRAHRIVRKCRKAAPGSADAARHLAASTEEAPQPPDAKCPSDPFWHSCPCVERLDAHAMTPKLGTILLLVPPGNHGNWLKEWEKSADADELTELKVELVHIHNTADKKDAPFSYDSDKHWQDLVTDKYKKGAILIVTSLDDILFLAKLKPT